MRGCSVRLCLQACRRYSSKVLELKTDKNYLKTFVRDRIRSGGPITVAEYMSLATRSAAGYYAQQASKSLIFGEKGDFITSPELSQVFGEIVGVWVYNELSNCGFSDEWQLVELGPGTGNLTSDVLRTLHTLQGDKLTVHLVEISDPLIDAQELALCGSNSAALTDKDYVRKNRTKSGIPVVWHRSLETVPKKFSVFIANEFFDALPIHMFERHGQTWREVYVNLNSSNDLCFMVSKNDNLHTKTLIPSWIRDDSNRVNWEVCPQAGALVTDIAQRVTQVGGFGLFIDYGHKGNRSEKSLRAYQSHQLVDPLSDPGAVDITADVDFGYWKKILSDICLTFGPIEQRYFLAQMGVRLRIERLLQQTSDLETRKHILDSYAMLTSADKDGMGMKFKMFSVFPKTLQPIIEKRGGFPAGFWPVLDEENDDEKVELSVD